MLRPTDEELTVGDGGGGDDILFQVVAREHLEGRSGLDHGDDAFQAGEVDLAVAGHEGGPEIAVHALAPGALAGRSVQAVAPAVVLNEVIVPAIADRGADEG